MGMLRRTMYSRRLSKPSHGKGGGMSVHFDFSAGTLLFLHDALYDDPHDRQKHLDAIRHIAGDLARPVEEIAERYEAELTQLKGRARIQDYLSVLVSKRVKQFYRRH